MIGKRHLPAAVLHEHHLNTERAETLLQKSKVPRCIKTYSRIIPLPVRSSLMNRKRAEKYLTMSKDASIVLPSHVDDSLESGYNLRESEGGTGICEYSTTQN